MAPPPSLLMNSHIGQPLEQRRLRQLLFQRLGGYRTILQTLKELALEVDGLGDGSRASLAVKDDLHLAADRQAAPPAPGARSCCAIEVRHYVGAYTVGTESVREKPGFPQRSQNIFAIHLGYALRTQAVHACAEQQCTEGQCRCHIFLHCSLLCDSNLRSVPRQRTEASPLPR